jgi:hypothetical protein
MDAIYELGSQMNTEKMRGTKYMLMSRHHNAGHKHNITIANRCFENVANFEYASTAVANLGMRGTSQFRTSCLFVCCMKI